MAGQIQKACAACSVAAARTGCIVLSLLFSMYKHPASHLTCIVNDCQLFMKKQSARRLVAGTNTIAGLMAVGCVVLQGGVAKGG